MPKKRPTVGLAMIVKDDVDDDLRTCLQSIAPHIDQIVLLGTAPKGNSVREVGPQFEAEVYHNDLWYDPATKSISDFAGPRNYAHQFLNPKLDWWLWADHDDEILGGEGLKAYLATLHEDIGGVWCPYIYSRDEYGNPTTVHYRERILRSNIGWKWQGRLHETLQPSNSLNWANTDLFEWLHRSDFANQSARNLPILEQWHKEEPENLRVWYYLGNQHYANGEKDKAARWWTKFYIDNRGTHVDRHQSMVWGANAWRELGNVKEAIRANMAAITEFPEIADSYLGMCENMLLLKQWKKAVVWGEAVLRHDPPEMVSFVNPLDYTWRVWRDLAVAYAGVEEYEKGVEACKLALNTRPNDEDVSSNLQVLEGKLATQKAVGGLVGFSTNGHRLRLTKALPAELMAEEPLRDIWVPGLLKRAYRGTQPRMVIMCGASLERWDGSTPYTTGIGGSETAVAEVSKRLSKEGWNVVVFNSCGRGEGDHDGVLYANWERYRAQNPCDVWVSWRHVMAAMETPNAQMKYFWCHDLHRGEQLTEKTANLHDKILTMSDWHKGHLRDLYPFLRDAQVDVVPNGIDLSRFGLSDTSVGTPNGLLKDGPPKRHHARFVYTSSPDRGLATLLRMWPHIRKVEPLAELHIFYGWESFLRAAEQGMYDLYRLKDMLVQLGQQPGIHWRGRVNQQVLAKELLAADIWAYPTSFLETFCITALEAMAANLKIITSSCGNIPYVVGDAGICIPGHASGIGYGRQFLPIVYTMMVDMNTQAQYWNRGPKRVTEFTWDKAMVKWLDLLKPSYIRSVGD